jgi:hypothetical protein
MNLTKMAHIGSLLVPSKRKKAKPQSKGKRTSKYKLDVEALLASSGDEDPDCIPKKNKLEVTFYVYVELPPTGNQTKGSKRMNASPKVIQKGPFFHTIDNDYATFLTKLADTLACKVKQIPTSKIVWKFEKPSNDKKKPLSSEAGYKAMGISLRDRKRDYVINIYLPRPIKDDMVRPSPINVQKLLQTMGSKAWDTDEGSVLDIDEEAGPLSAKEKIVRGSHHCDVKYSIHEGRNDEKCYKVYPRT